MACFLNGIHDDVVDATTQALNYLREEPPLLPTMSLGYSMFSGKLNREEILEKIKRGYPITEEEFDRL
jgi:hypothetical protein